MAGHGVERLSGRLASRLCLMGTTPVRQIISWRSPELFTHESITGCGLWALFAAEKNSAATVGRMMHTSEVCEIESGPWWRFEWQGMKAGKDSIKQVSVVLLLGNQSAALRTSAASRSQDAVSGSFLDSRSWRGIRMQHSCRPAAQVSAEMASAAPTTTGLRKCFGLWGICSSRLCKCPNVIGWGAQRRGHEAWQKHISDLKSVVQTYPCKQSRSSELFVATSGKGHVG